MSAAKKVLYEVNIDVLASSAHDYRVWLKDHVEKMKTALGYQSVVVTERGTCPFADTEAARAAVTDPDLRNQPFFGFTVIYVVESQAKLDDYLQHRAAAMRNEAMEQFGGKFHGWRRIEEIA